MQRLSSIRRASWGLVLVALLSFVSARADAITICDGGCFETGPGTSGPLSFDTQLRPEDGSRVSVAATGTVYIFGLFTTDGGDVRLTAENTITIDVGNVDFSGINLFLTVNDNGATEPPPGTVITPPIGSLPPIGGLPRLDGDGSISIDGGGLVIGNGGSISLASFDIDDEEAVAFVPVTSTFKNGRTGGDIVGNVFLDLSGLTLDDITIEAGRDIIWSNVNPIVTPEPGTALLMGLGLTLLGARRGTGTRS